MQPRLKNEIMHHQYENEIVVEEYMLSQDDIGFKF
jgi:hypothetical protein